MTTRYAQLSPLGLGVGFGAGVLIAMALFFVPMGFSTFGMHGYGSMMGASGLMMGPGTALLACFWAAVASALAGAVIAVVYNALIRATKAAGAESPKSS